jgi:muconate cycloisomerase
VDLRQPLQWGREDELRQLNHVLIRLGLSDGSVGIAEATPRPSIYGETQTSIQHMVNEILAPMLLGAALDSFESVAALSQRLDRIKNNNTAKGALDMAMHQALSRSKGLTLAGYLGCSRERIPLSAIVSTGTLDQVSADVEQIYASGLRVFKIKIGKNIHEETATLARLIDDFPAAKFYVDANQTLHPHEATTQLSRLSDLGVIHCEEALPIQRVHARQRLRQHSVMPIIADDSVFTLVDLQRELEFDTFDILNIKTARTGFSTSRRMLRLCRQWGKEVMVGSQASSLLGCLYAATFAAQAGIDCANECSFFLKTAADLTLAPPIVAGCLRLDDVQTAIAKLTEELA